MTLIVIPHLRVSGFLQHLPNVGEPGATVAGVRTERVVVLNDDIIAFEHLLPAGDGSGIGRFFSVE